MGVVVTTQGVVASVGVGGGDKAVSVSGPPAIVPII